MTAGSSVLPSIGGRLVRSMSLPKFVGYLLLLWLFVAPLVLLIYGSFRTTPYGSGAWTFDGFRDAYGDPETLAALLRSFAYAASSALLAMAIAIYFATLATRFDVGLRRIITPIMAVILVFPGFLYVLSWSAVAAGDDGILDQLLIGIGLGGLAESIDMRSWPGLILTTAVKTASLAYFVVLGSFKNRSGAVEDAARVSGAGRVRAIVDIELPQLTPALLAAGFLVFIKIIEAFEAPLMLGGPVGIEVYSTYIFDYLRGGIRPNYTAASASSLVIVVVLALLIAFQWRIARSDKSFATIGSRGGVATLHRPARGGMLLTASIVMYGVSMVLLPLAQSLIAAFSPFLGSPSFGLSNIREVLGDAGAINSIRTTLIVAGLGAAVSVALAFTIAYAFIRSTSAGGKLIQVASWIPLGMPGLVLGLAFLWTALATPGARQLYGTPFLLAIALGVATVPVAARSVEGGLAQVPLELEHAARVSGSGFTRSLLSVTVRLVVPSLVAAWLVVAVVMSGILDIPMMLGTPSSQMVAQTAYAMYQNGEVGQASAVYLIYLLAFALIAFVLWAVLFAVRKLSVSRRGNRHALAVDVIPTEMSLRG